MRRKHVLAFIGLLCTLALTLSVALAEEDGLFLPEELGSVEAQAGELTIEDSTLIDGLADGDALSLPEALDLGELRFDDVAEAPAAQEAVAANGIEDYWTGEQFDAWYEAQKTTAASADHLLGPGGDLFSNYQTVIFPGETIAVVPVNTGVSDSGMDKYGQMGFDFTLYQMDDPVVLTECEGINLLPRTGTPEKTALTAVAEQVIHVPYRARAGFTNMGEGSVSEIPYVSLYRNDTGHPLVLVHDDFTKSDSAPKMLGYGGNNTGNPSFVGSGTINSQPRLYFLENYYEIHYNYGDVSQSELFFPADTPAQYADRIYIDKEEHTYQMPRPLRKGYLFDGWDGWGVWCWDYLPYHEDPIKTSESTGTVASMTDNAYTYTMNFEKFVLGQGSRIAPKDATLDAKFMEPKTYYDTSCLTVGFNPQGGTVEGQKYLLREACPGGSRDFELDIGKVKPVREGYTFKGWCTDPKDEAGTLIKDASPESASAWTQYGHTELYAVWQSNTPTTISLAKAKVAAIKAQTYTGKAIKPAVKVTLEGKTLKKGTDYTVSYKNNKAIGKATVTVKGKGNYTGTVSKAFVINPKAVSLASLTSGKGKLTVKWKKGTGGAGYQLQYSLKRTFKSSTTVKITKMATVSRVLKNLKSGKTYYVRIRGYKLVGGKAYVSPWSKALSKKVK